MDYSRDGYSHYDGNQERDRMQENLSKAFSLLDDDQPRGQTSYGGGGGNSANLYGGHRIGTAPAGGGAGALGYGGGSDADSDIDAGSMVRGGNNLRGSGGVGGGLIGNSTNQYGVPELGLQPTNSFGGGGLNAASEVATLNVGGSRRSA